MSHPVFDHAVLIDRVRKEQYGEGCEEEEEGEDGTGRGKMKKKEGKGEEHELARHSPRLCTLFG